MRTTQTLFLVVLLLVGAGTAHAQTSRYGFTQHLNAAQMGMGGLTTTVATNAHTVIYNPGMLTRQPFALEITMPIGADLDMLDMSDFISNHQDDFSDFSSLEPEEQSQFIKDGEAFDNKYYGFDVGPFFGLSFKNFGVAGYGILNGDTKLDLGVLAPTIGLRGLVEVGGAVGLGRTFEIAGREIGIGVAGRFLQRSSLPSQRLTASDASDPQGIMETLQDEAEDPYSGFGIDVGAIHTLELGEPGSDINLDLAAVIQDFYGSIDGEYRIPNLKLGGMYHMPFAGNAFIRRWDVGVDVVDIFNREGVSFFQRINMGTELSMLAGLVSVRGGFHQGYPTLGAGVRLAIIKLDVAMYTEEMGTYPGQNPSDIVVGQLSFGW
ncbi:hypothetical protein KQI63_10035 [bacterium]|nr:hypothetical protein [bacterium]